MDVISVNASIGTLDIVLYTNKKGLMNVSEIISSIHLESFKTFSITTTMQLKKNS